MVTTFFMVICFTLFLSACLPVKNENVNTELFESSTEIREKAAQLKRGMKKDKVFQTLAVPIEKFSTMDTADVQTAVYGNSQVQGTPEQLEKFRKRLQAYSGYSLPYRHVKSKSSLGFGKVKTKSTGQDLQLVLIFESNKLLKASVVGNDALKKSEDKYIWNSLLKTGVGSVF